MRGRAAIGFEKDEFDPISWVMLIPFLFPGTLAPLVQKVRRTVGSRRLFIVYSIMVRGVCDSRHPRRCFLSRGEIKQFLGGLGHLTTSNVRSNVFDSVNRLFEFPQKPAYG